MTSTETTAPATFAVGDVVTAGGGSDYVWTFTVIARTAKFVTLRQHGSIDTMRVGIRVHDGTEWASPFGSYSMAPVICAGR